MSVHLRGVVGLALVLLVSAPAGAADAGGGGVRRIAVVNVSRVFDAYQKVKDIKTKIQNDFKPRQTELEAKQKMLVEQQDKLRVEQPTVDPKDVNFFLKVQAMQKDEFELKVKFQAMAEDIEKVKMEQMKQVLLDIRASIKEIGAQDGFDLVMRAPEYDALNAKPDPANPDDEAPKTAGELVRQFRENPVLFFSEGVDITEKVINALNKHYKPALGAAPVVAPATGPK